MDAIVKEKFDEKNMGTVDRGIRIALAIIVAILYFTGKISGIAAIILGVFAIVFVITSMVGELSCLFSARNKDL